MAVCHERFDAVGLAFEGFAVSGTGDSQVSFRQFANPVKAFERQADCIETFVANGACFVVAMMRQKLAAT